MSAIASALVAVVVILGALEARRDYRDGGHVAVIPTDRPHHRPACGQLVIPSRDKE